MGINIADIQIIGGFYYKMNTLDKYRLCYVDNNILYFTDNFENQWGDDWNDAPYEHNAGEPYEWDDSYTEKENREHGYGHLRYIAYKSDKYIREPNDRYDNSPYSVEDINKGAIAWLYSSRAGALPAGSTMGQAVEWLKNVNAVWGELTK